MLELIQNIIVMIEVCDPYFSITIVQGLVRAILVGKDEARVRFIIA
jgi:hypothetical protein